MVRKVKSASGAGRRLQKSQEKRERGTDVGGPYPQELSMMVRSRSWVSLEWIRKSRSQEIANKKGSMLF